MKFPSKYANYKKYQNNSYNNYMRSMSGIWSDYSKTQRNFGKFINSHASIFTIIENYFKYKSLTRKVYR